MPTDTVEDYLKAIHRIESRTGPPVSTSAIAEALGKAPATVTSMLETLSDRGLLTRENRLEFLLFDSRTIVADIDNDLAVAALFVVYADNDARIVAVVVFDAVRDELLEHSNE